MKQGFVKVAAASCAVVVADVREIRESFWKPFIRWRLRARSDGTPGAGSHRLHL